MNSTQYLGSFEVETNHTDYSFSDTPFGLECHSFMNRSLKHIIIMTNLHSVLATVKVRRKRTMMFRIIAAAVDSLANYARDIVCFK